MAEGLAWDGGGPCPDSWESGTAVTSCLPTGCCAIQGGSPAKGSATVAVPPCNPGGGGDGRTWAFRLRTRQRDPRSDPRARPILAQGGLPRTSGRGWRRRSRSERRGRCRQRPGRIGGRGARDFRSASPPNLNASHNARAPKHVALREKTRASRSRANRGTCRRACHVPARVTDVNAKQEPWRQKGKHRHARGGRGQLRAETP